MNKNTSATNHIANVFLFIPLLFFCAGSCKPVIHSFKITTHDTTQVRKMTESDTLKVNWDVKGKPTLLVSEHQSTDSVTRVLELKLVVEKGTKEIQRAIQVEVLPERSTTAITFRSKLRGDTLVADDLKNPGVWGDRFEISSVSNSSRRPLVVTHAGRTGLLEENGMPSDAFAGTALEGRWIMVSPLTPAEKADHSLLPERLSIATTIIYKRR